MLPKKSDNLPGLTNVTGKYTKKILSENICKFLLHKFISADNPSNYKNGCQFGTATRSASEEVVSNLCKNDGNSNMYTNEENFYSRMTASTDASPCRTTLIKNRGGVSNDGCNNIKYPVINRTKKYDVSSPSWPYSLSNSASNRNSRGQDTVSRPFNMMSYEKSSSSDSRNSLLNRSSSQSIKAMISPTKNISFTDCSKLSKSRDMNIFNKQMKKSESSSIKSDISKASSKPAGVIRPQRLNLGSHKDNNSYCELPCSEDNLSRISSRQRSYSRWSNSDCSSVCYPTNDDAAMFLKRAHSQGHSPGDMSPGRGMLSGSSSKLSAKQWGYPVDNACQGLPGPSYTQTALAYYVPDLLREEYDRMNKSQSQAQRAVVLPRRKMVIKPECEPRLSAKTNPNLIVQLKCLESRIKELIHQSVVKSRRTLSTSSSASSSSNSIESPMLYDSMSHTSRGSSPSSRTRGHPAPSIASSSTESGWASAGRDEDTPKPRQRLHHMEEMPRMSKYRGGGSSRSSTKSNQQELPTENVSMLQQFTPEELQYLLQAVRDLLQLRESNSNIDGVSMRQSYSSLRKSSSVMMGGSGLYNNDDCRASEVDLDDEDGDPDDQITPEPARHISNNSQIDYVEDGKPLDAAYYYHNQMHPNQLQHKLNYGDDTLPKSSGNAENSSEFQLQSPTSDVMHDKLPIGFQHFKRYLDNKFGPDHHDSSSLRKEANNFNQGLDKQSVKYWIGKQQQQDKQVAPHHHGHCAGGSSGHLASQGNGLRRTHSQPEHGDMQNLMHLPASANNTSEHDYQPQEEVDIGFVPERRHILPGYYQPHGRPLYPARGQDPISTNCPPIAYRGAYVGEIDQNLLVSNFFDMRIDPCKGPYLGMNPSIGRYPPGYFFDAEDPHFAPHSSLYNTPEMEYIPQHGLSMMTNEMDQKSRQVRQIPPRQQSQMMPHHSSQQPQQAPLKPSSAYGLSHGPPPQISRNSNHAMHHNPKVMPHSHALQHMQQKQPPAMSSPQQQASIPTGHSGMGRCYVAHTQPTQSQRSSSRGLSNSGSGYAIQANSSISAQANPPLSKAIDSIPADQLSAMTCPAGYCSEKCYPMNAIMPHNFINYPCNSQPNSKSSHGSNNIPGPNQCSMMTNSLSASDLAAIQNGSAGSNNGMQNRRAVTPVIDLPGSQSVTASSSSGNSSKNMISQSNSTNQNMGLPQEPKLVPQKLESLLKKLKTFIDLDNYTTFPLPRGWAEGATIHGQKYYMYNGAQSSANSSSASSNNSSSGNIPENEDQLSTLIPASQRNTTTAITYDHPYLSTRVPFGWERVDWCRDSVYYRHLLIPHTSRYHPNMWVISKLKDPNVEKEDWFLELRNLQNSLNTRFIAGVMHSMEAYKHATEEHEKYVAEFESVEPAKLVEFVRHLDRLYYLEMREIVIAYEQMRQAVAERLFAMNPSSVPFEFANKE